MGGYERELGPLRLRPYSCMLAKKALAFKYLALGPGRLAPEPAVLLCELEGVRPLRAARSARRVGPPDPVRQAAGVDACPRATSA